MKYVFYLRAAIFAAFFSALLSGCISDDGSTRQSEPVAGIAVEFPTTISKTRAYDDMWEWGDDIGVYMIPAAETPVTNWNTIDLYAENRHYTHDMDQGDVPDKKVVFTGFDKANTILWPGDERKFDVVAYYPWRETIDGGYLYPVDLSDQSSQKDIDLMWSDNVKGRSSGAPTLGFVHKLANLKLNVTDTTGASLDGMTATFDGLPTSASFSLATGEIVGGTEGEVEPFEGHLLLTDDAVGDDDIRESAIVEAIVLPGSRPAGCTVTFTLEDGQQALFTVTAPVYVAGNRYTYNIRLTPPAQQGASFGVDGELKQITQWVDGEEGDYPGDIPKTDPDPGGKPSSAWRTEPNKKFLPEEYPIAWVINSYQVMNANLTITKQGCEGIVSVTVNLKCAGTETTIGTVKVGGHSLVIDNDGNPATPPVKNYNLPVTLNPTDFTFHTTDGKPRSGDVTIEIAAGDSNTLVYGWGTNTDIAENNP